MCKRNAELNAQAIKMMKKMEEASKKEESKEKDTKVPEEKTETPKDPKAATDKLVKEQQESLKAKDKMDKEM